MGLRLGPEALDETLLYAPAWIALEHCVSCRRFDQPPARPDRVQVRPGRRQVGLDSVYRAYAKVEVHDDRLGGHVPTGPIPAAGRRAADRRLGSDKGEAIGWGLNLVRVREARVVQQRGDVDDLLVVPQPLVGGDDRCPDVGAVGVVDEEPGVQLLAYVLGPASGLRIRDAQVVQIELRPPPRTQAELPSDRQR